MLANVTEEKLSRPDQRLPRLSEGRSKRGLRIDQAQGEKVVGRFRKTAPHPRLRDTVLEPEMLVPREVSGQIIPALFVKQFEHRTSLITRGRILRSGFQGVRFRLNVRGSIAGNNEQNVRR